MRNTTWPPAVCALAVPASLLTDGWTTVVTKHAVVHDVEGTMRFIHLYLIGYCFLVLGAVIALWQTGVLQRVAPVWIGVGILVAAGLGIMFSVRSGRLTISEEIER
jgi:hypothetical protein